jgi:hypothetical protein
MMIAHRENAMADSVENCDASTQGKMIASPDLTTFHISGRCVFPSM